MKTQTPAEFHAQAMSDAQPAFVLHAQAYRETSQLVDLFCRGHGRVRVVARRARGGREPLLLRPFIPQLVAWRGRGQLKTLTRAEPAGVSVPWDGEKLYLGMYLNELLMRLLPLQCADESLFDRYSRLILELPLADDVESLLRSFELALLQSLGYGLDLRFASDSGEPIRPEHWFEFRAGEGLVRPAAGTISVERHFSGYQLLAMRESRYDDPAVRRAAKRLLRQALHVHLGDRPLYSRELFGVALAHTHRSSQR